MRQFLPKHFQSISFYKKQLVFILAINAICLALASVLLFSSNVSSYKENLRSSMLGNIKLIEAASTSALLFHDQEAAKIILSAFKEDSTIYYAAIYDTENQLFAEYRRDDYAFPHLSHTHEIGFFDKATHFEIYDNIRFDSEDIGHIHIFASREKAEQQIRHYFLIICGVFIFSLLLAFMMSRYAQKLISKPIEELVDIARYVSTKSSYDRRIQTRRGDELGTLISGFNAMLDAIEDREKKLTDYSMHMEDLVAERTAELDKKANYDALTHLPNRNYLFDKMTQSINLADRNDSMMYVMFLDLDRFKIINDNLGHAIGDELLALVADRLEKTVRKVDTIARWGGDEFVILLESIRRAEDAARVAKKIIDELERPFTVREHVLHISTCIGISSFPHDGRDTETLLKNADMSMYEAKRQGVGTFSFFEKEMQSRSIERLQLEVDLRDALKNDQFFLVYQPKYNIPSNDVTSAEALIRWRHPTRGIVPPNLFIPIAEEAGLIKQIGLWVVEEACRQNTEWQAGGLDPVKVAVNISASHIIDPQFPQSIIETLQRFNLPSQALEIEITESSLVEVSDDIFSILTTLRDNGISVAIDDFGAGYSCLRYLCEFPVDTLKIDGSFIQGICSHESKQGVVAATVALGHNLGMEVVAECVEEQVQYDYLKSIHCDVIQGYFYSMPLESAAFVQLLNSPALKKIS